MARVQLALTELTHTPRHIVNPLPVELPHPRPPPAPTTASPSQAESLGAHRSVPFVIPPQFLKPGVEMLKVSRKSARRVKPRKMWLEISSETPEDGELGLEVGVGMVGGQDVRLCWEKNGLGIGELFHPSIHAAR